MVTDVNRTLEFTEPRPQGALPSHLSANSSIAIAWKPATLVVVWFSPGMECTAAKRLLDEYTEALGVFHTAQEPLTRMVPGDPDYNRARIDREESYVELARSRGVYWKHVQMHGCRAALSQRSRQKEIYTRLQNDLLEARRRFDGASAEYQVLHRVARDDAGTADGAFALNRAKRVHVNAHDAYLSALQRFTDFVTQGVIPDDVLPE